MEAKRGRIFTQYTLEHECLFSSSSCKVKGQYYGIVSLCLKSMCVRGSPCRYLKFYLSGVGAVEHGGFVVPVWGRAWTTCVCMVFKSYNCCQCKFSDRVNLKLWGHLLLVFSNFPGSRTTCLRREKLTFRHFIVLNMIKKQFSMNTT